MFAEALLRAEALDTSYVYSPMAEALHSMYTVDTKFMFLKLKIWTFAYIEDKHRSKESTRFPLFVVLFFR